MICISTILFSSSNSPVIILKANVRLPKIKSEATCVCQTCLQKTIGLPQSRCFQSKQMKAQLKKESLVYQASAQIKGKWHQNGGFAKEV